MNHSRRYYLHQAIKKKGFKYSAHERTVFIPHDEELTDKHVIQLQTEFGYNIQLEIH